MEKRFATTSWPEFSGTLCNRGWTGTQIWETAARKQSKKIWKKTYISTADPSCRTSVWYLPHHSVINKQKPDKIRRVISRAWKYKRISRNDTMLTRPDLLGNLHGLQTVLSSNHWGHWGNVHGDWNPTTRPALSTLPVDRGWQWEDLQIQSTHFWSHMQLLVRSFFWRSVQMTTNKNIQRRTHLSCIFYKWLQADLPFWRGGSQKCRYQNCSADRMIQSDKTEH